ncbi:hypothetical protein [Propionispora hippei]|uniref:Uncharacterized protein n=1 Tax=Propionispora hippei DSM 15287 TaxID=1123003 RepID=A0A1M6DWV4_9FIRM|nr:hypothetical protein [Propionispora hippei]SHI77609.1 hypothetical protein SAMN02745170_01029 [Propionispora hippei DSM 15287]
MHNKNKPGAEALGLFLSGKINRMKLTCVFTYVLFFLLWQAPAFSLSGGFSHRLEK